MKDYIVVDLENPNGRQNSICSIGIVIVRNHEVVDEIYSLINPEDDFEFMNIRITGITPDMVLDSPTLPEFWPKIKDLLVNNIIVGHNITYDLRVISKSLNRYNMEIPDFNYSCTLALSRKHLNYPSNKLTSLAGYLGIEYQAHIAIEDARATYQLFEHINDLKTVKKDECRSYHYAPKTTEKYDPKLSSNINNLHGIIQSFTYRQSVSQKQLELLHEWLLANIKFNQYAIFKNINTELYPVVTNKKLDNYVIRDLLTTVPEITKSNVYKNNTLKIQVLQGIIKGVTCDGFVTMGELQHIEKWIDNNKSLRGLYIYDKVKEIVSDAISKGYLSAADEEALSRKLKSYLSPIKNTNKRIDFEGKTYCLSGDFKHGSKSKIKKTLDECGLVEKSCISSKVDYLFVGDLGSPAWKYGVIGGKIIKAQKLQDKGCNIEIISENNLFDEIDRINDN